MSVCPYPTFYPNVAEFMDADVFSLDRDGVRELLMLEKSFQRLITERKNILYHRYFELTQEEAALDCSDSEIGPNSEERE